MTCYPDTHPTVARRGVSLGGVAAWSAGREPELDEPFLRDLMWGQPADRLPTQLDAAALPVHQPDDRAQ